MIEFKNKNNGKKISKFYIISKKTILLLYSFFNIKMRLLSQRLKHTFNTY